MFQYQMPHPCHGVGSANLEQRQRFESAGKLHRERVQQDGTRHLRQRLVARREHSDLLAECRQRRRYLANDIGNAPDFAARQRSVLRCHHQDVHC
jgi:hypothetical protein